VPSKGHVRLSSLLDYALDTLALPLERGTIETMFSNYKTTLGEFPHPDIEPTED
jgi:hypothetical protein